MGHRLIVGAWIVVVLAGCGQHATYRCEATSQCQLSGQQGTCEPDGHCAFPDPSCAEGNRYEPSAGDGFGGLCVGETGDAGTPSCGVLGGACCASGPACGNNTFCDGGTCKQCITDVAPGIGHTCFLKYDGTVWCSGRDDEGQLGNGGMSSVPTTTPVQVRDSTNAAITDATKLGTGQIDTCAIRADKTLWCWGGSNQCAAGGQLGDGNTSSSAVAVRVVRDDGMPFTDIAEVTGDYCHMCARDNTGHLWCWGSKEDGGLGDGGANPHAAAVPVTAPGGVPISDAAQLSGGGSHTCYRTMAGAVSCWGLNNAGQLGDGTKMARPNPVHAVDGTTSFAVGRFHTCASKADGTAVCWGQGSQARLGNGTGDRSAGGALDQVAPVAVLTAPGGIPFPNVSSVAAGASSCLVTSTKELWCWGTNNYGQTGTGAGTYVPAPVLKVDGTALHNVTRVIAAFTRTCAFTGDGALYCWGRNSEGQLGTGDLKNVGLATPVKLSCP